MAKIENEKIKESNNSISNELLELKKNLAKEITDKLMEKDSNLMTSIVKGSIRNYLVNENTLVDVIHDEVILGGLGELTGLITPTLKKYREMFSKVSTNNELENLRTTIFNEIGGTELASTTTKESSDNKTKETSESTGNKIETEQETVKENESKKEETKKQSSNSSKKTSEKKENSQEGVDKEKKTYTNAKSGLTYNLYDQALGPRGKLKYKDRNTTVANIGCMLTSAACVTSAVDSSKTPKDFFVSHPHTNVFKSIPKMTNKWDAKQITGKNKQQAIEENLRKGYPAIFMVRGRKRGGKNTCTTSQHYMAAVDIREKDGKKEVFIANTHNNRGGGWISTDKAFTSMKEASIYTPTQA